MGIARTERTAAAPGPWGAVTSRLGTMEAAMTCLGGTAGSYTARAKSGTSGHFTQGPLS